MHFDRQYPPPSGGPILKTGVYYPLSVVCGRYGKGLIFVDNLIRRQLAVYVARSGARGIVLL